MLIKYVARLLKRLLINHKAKRIRGLLGFSTYPLKIKKSLHPNGKREGELRPPSRVLRIDT
jgi:hypothetical protein